MHSTQKTYMIAKATYQSAIECINEEMAAIEPLLAVNEDLYYEKWEAISEKYQSDVLFRAMRNAETAMIEWANAKVSKSKHFTARHKAAMAEINANLHMPATRAKMVDLAFRLA